MDITAISDLHGHLPKDLPGGDLLILAGDYTANDSIQQWDYFYDWLSLLPYTKKVFIAGNHDNQLADKKRPIPQYCDAEYLEDSGTEFMGVKIYGSPWTSTFKGMNPKCKAFTCDTDEQLADKFEKIPNDVDILITHSPPYTILDKTDDDLQVGSTYLMGALIYAFRPKIWVFGHIHESHGSVWYKEMTHCINASYVDERYRPVNKPMRIQL